MICHYNSAKVTPFSISLILIQLLLCSPTGQPLQLTGATHRDLPLWTTQKMMKMGNSSPEIPLLLPVCTTSGWISSEQEKGRSFWTNVQWLPSCYRPQLVQVDSQHSSRGDIPGDIMALSCQVFISNRLKTDGMLSFSTWWSRPSQEILRCKFNFLASVLSSAMDQWFMFSGLLSS